MLPACVGGNGLGSLLGAEGVVPREINDGVNLTNLHGITGRELS
jgi:hypothetical protein